MAFLGPLFDLINLANQVLNIINNLAKEKERAKEELKRRGIDVEPEIVIIKVGNEYKAGVIVDLPGNVEKDIANILNMLGAGIKTIECKEA